ncbi:hypothetical protein [Parasitella parasitica]|uniref:Uncharacterized protein n=1 Tax=Parasitella parasitica TaxID=35722 RepID=A0A0B7MWH4_9FUNG|nr:hypothetical protein [Parasitella parasitica]
MNHGLSQRENVRRNPVAENQGENAKPIHSSASNTIKPPGLSSKPSNAPSKPKPFSDAKPRPILSDKSNKSLQQSKQHVKTVKETTTKVIVEEKITIKKEDTLDPIDATKEEFFQDNQSRYKEDEESRISIVPVLPIKVPEKLKHMFTNEASSLGTKRSFEALDDTPSVVAEKKLKSSLSHPQDLFVENAPPIGFDVNEETIKYDREQEMRAKLAMLQTTQNLKESQWNDPMLVAEYAGEIFGYLYDSEPALMADPMYANNQQHDVSWKMRSVLVDWVIEIHYLFGLLPETLFLAVNIIDRFLSVRTVALGKLQLVGITALSIATKFEEIRCPSMQDFLFMTDNAVTEDEFIKAERFVMQILDFRFCYPNPLNFLRRVCNDETKCDVHTRTLAKYFMEISCIDHTFIGVRPSKIAAAALWLSKKMLAKGKWNNSLTKLSGYAPHDFRATVEAMLDYLSQPITHDAFFKKWSTKKLSKASIFVRDWINRYYIN